MKFKLAKKRIEQQNVSQKETGRRFKSSSQYFDIHPMAAGDLICNKEHRVNQSYQKEIRNRSMSVKESKVESQSNQRFLRKTHQKEKKSTTQQVVGRLHLTGQKKYKNRMVRSLVNKYSRLSERCQEEIKRPATAVPWKGESPFKKLLSFR